MPMLMAVVSLSLLFFSLSFFFFKEPLIVLLISFFFCPYSVFLTSTSSSSGSGCLQPCIQYAPAWKLIWSVVSSQLVHRPYWVRNVFCMLQLECLQYCVIRSVLVPCCLLLCIDHLGALKVLRKQGLVLVCKAVTELWTELFGLHWAELSSPWWILGIAETEDRVLFFKKKTNFLKD